MEYEWGGLFLSFDRTIRWAFMLTKPRGAFHYRRRLIAIRDSSGSRIEMLVFLCSSVPFNNNITRRVQHKSS
jgi:hypothetical protein